MQLGDDEFEEHILEYPPDRAGLYLHGINQNDPEFITWPYSKLREFATQFGFHIVDCIVVNTVDEVKSFTDKCRPTGSYQGRPIEGFVIRGHSKTNGHAFFFKVKYDNPYLMYREWRELTKGLLSGKSPRHRYDLTRLYEQWCREKIKSDPRLFEGYKHNKGIIKVRKLFLEEKGITPEDAASAKLEEDAPPISDGEKNDFQEDEVEIGGSSIHKTEWKPPPGPISSHSKILLLPIATIGSGKTTLGHMMNEIYDIGHIQNDNISGKSARSTFHKHIIEEFQKKRIVFADKNNHLFMHRYDLCREVKKKYPGVWIIVLDFGVDRLDPATVVKIAIERVEARGENHQSLTPQRTNDFKSVIWRFQTYRDKFQPGHPQEGPVDRIIHVDMTNDPITNYKIIVQNIGSEIGLTMPSDTELETALKHAQTHEVTFRKEVKSGKKSSPRYIGLRIINDIQPILGEIFKKDDHTLSSGKQLFESIQKRWPNHHHVTLAHLKDPSSSDLIPSFLQRIQASSSHELEFDFAVNELLWNERIMALRVHGIPSDMVTEGKEYHITVGTLNDDVKAFESNQLIKDADAGNKNIHRISLENINLKGLLAEFY